MREPDPITVPGIIVPGTGCGNGKYAGSGSEEHGN